MVNKKINKWGIVFTILSMVQTMVSQTVTIGTGTTVDQGLPIEPYYGYTYSQSIFDQSEISTNGDIDKIRFYCDGSSSYTDNPVAIYLGHTTKTTFANTTDWVSSASLTQVYNGPITTTATPGWIEIDITNFTYNNTDNLIVAVDENQSGYHGSGDDWYCTSSTGNKALVYRNDVTNPDPASPPTATYLKSYRPNIQLEFVSTTPMTYVSSTTTQSNTSDVPPGSTDQQIVGIEVVTSGSLSPFDVDQIQFNMNGCTDGTNDITNINIYYTGNNSSFATTTLFGNATPATGTITVNGSQTLASGTNYFWIAYDIAAGATLGNFVDAQCSQINLTGGIGAKTPTVTAPGGNREIPLVPVIYLMDNTSESTCYGEFYDPGGSASNYSDDQDFTKTFCSNNGNNLRFDFTYFDLQSTWDYLRIYDGANTSSTLIGTYSTTVPVNIISSGTCLTFEFHSDCCVNKGGWAADISCFDPGVCGVNPSAEDQCADAPLLNSIDGICGTTGGYTADIPGNLQSETCNGLNFINGNSWLQFQASSTTAELAIICNCPGSGVEVSVFETSDCNTFTEMGCYDPFYEQAPGVFTVNGLTIGNNYHLMVDQFGAAGCDFQINGLSGVSLPVTLSSFDVSCNGISNKLVWTTSSEINNDYFSIQRSTDGVLFEEIGKVSGAGNSSNSIHYQFIDQNPVKGAYYRLKQFDYNGDYNYSSTKYSNCGSSQFHLYPNPANDHFIFYSDQFDHQKLSVNLVDALGKIIRSMNISDFDSNKHYHFDVQGIPKGVYQVLFYSSSSYITQSLIIY